MMIIMILTNQGAWLQIGLIQHAKGYQIRADLQTKGVSS